MSTAIEIAQAVRRRIDGLRADLDELRQMPVVTVNMMYKRTADNDPFFRELTREWYEGVRARHPRWPIIRAMEWGVAICTLPRTFDEYFMYVEASARRNAKKAERAGYRCRSFKLTEEFLDDVRAIHTSTDVRQGKVSQEILEGRVAPVADPQSRTPYHDFPYCGVFLGSKLVAYTSFFVCGEMASVERILGHAEHQAFGVVPLVLVGMTKHIYRYHPSVRHLVYGSYFGAGPSMRRFKKKFRFFPHRVHWKLDTRETASDSRHG